MKYFPKEMTNSKENDSAIQFRNLEQNWIQLQFTNIVKKNNLNKN